VLLPTQARQVAPVFNALRSRYSAAMAFAGAQPLELREIFYPLGLRWRIEMLLKLAVEIGKVSGHIPLTEPELRRLPGVGEYAAAAALSLHAGRRAVIIDSNVVRLLCRLTGQDYHGETRRAPWLRKLADRLTPEVSFQRYGYALLDHSIKVCRPRSPLCSRCPLNSLCCYAADAEAPASAPS